MTKKQKQRIVELRKTLLDCAHPLKDVDLLRQIVDELLAILLKEPGETHG
jgi:hypothetical protein